MPRGFSRVLSPQVRAPPRAVRSGAAFAFAAPMSLPSLAGTLRVYRRDPSTLVAFESGPSRPTGGTVVFVPGLTDGPMSLSYLPRLAEALADAAARRRTFRLCQPVLSSSYLGFGVSSLRRDCEELDDVIRGVGPAHPGGDKDVILVGHSTGCQDAVAYCARGAHASRLRAIILQAPVSDREAMAMDAGEDAIEAASATAASLVAEGRGDRLMPRDAPGVFATPITAERYASLSGRMGEDDMFSSDLTDAELEAKLKGVAELGVPVMLAVSAGDQHVPARVKNDYGALEARLFRAAGGERCAKSVVARQEGNHALEGEAGERFVRDACRFIDALYDDEDDA